MGDSRVDVNRRGRVRERSWRSIPARARALIAAAPVRPLRNLALIIQVATVFNGRNFVYFRCVLPESLDRRRPRTLTQHFENSSPQLYSATGVCNHALWAKSPARRTTPFLTIIRGRVQAEFLSEIGISSLAIFVQWEPDE
jgi:hypothetical protein